MRRLGYLVLSLMMVLFVATACFAKGEVAAEKKDLLGRTCIIKVIVLKDAYEIVSGVDLLNDGEFYHVETEYAPVKKVISPAQIEWKFQGVPCVNPQETLDVALGVPGEEEGTYEVTLYPLEASGSGWEYVVTFDIRGTILQVTTESASF